MNLFAGRLARFSLATAATLLLGLAILVPAGTSTHNDGVYDQPVWFEWNRTQLQVVIVPADHGQIFNGNGVLGGTNPNELHPCLNSYTLAMRDSTLAWNTAIQQFGPAWLKAMPISVYVAGCDPVPPTVSITGADILVLSDQNKGPVLGVAVSTTPCLVDNSKFFITSFTYNDMYNINGQEYGHCLGLEHVGGDHPSHDVMDGGYDDTPGSSTTHRHCISNLNVKGLEGVFADAFNQPGAGQPGTVAVGSYTKIAC